MNAGMIWPLDKTYTHREWLAGEILHALYGEEQEIPEDENPLVFMIKKHPRLHAHWIERIAYFEDSAPPNKTDQT